MRNLMLPLPTSPSLSRECIKKAPGKGGTGEFVMKEGYIKTSSHNLTP